VSRRVDRAADRSNLLLGLGSHATVLRERPRPLDGRLVDTLSSVKGVVAAVGRVVSANRPGLAGGENIPAFDDVVLDERVAGPAVEGEVARSLRVVCAGVLDGPGRKAVSILCEGIEYGTTYFRPACQPLPATKPPPACPFHEQVYFPPPCCWQLNCPEPSVQYCHGAFWRVIRSLLTVPAGAAMADGTRARAETTIAVKEIMMLDEA
jgi:hypothetical protein